LSGVKLLSDMSIGLMNFVQEGYTITLTTTPSKKLFSYLHKYDRVLGKVGGKVYLAKDSRMASHNFNKMYPDLQKFRDIRIKYRLQKFSSDLSVRLKF
jgi:decaprenylphospho-beta-D-ribofuranose 2-oxidase